MKYNIGCEVGNYDTKLITREKKLIQNIVNKGGEMLDDGSAVMGILNVVSLAKERRSLGTVKASLVNMLDVTIETKSEGASGRWFVGGLALKEGSNLLKPTREDEKSQNPITMVMLLTTLAFSLYDTAEPVKKEIINLGTLLPTEEYFKDGYGVEFINKIKGEHKITFNDPIFKGGKITLKINDVELMPEGAAGQTATTFDWNGEAFDQDYENKTILNIDIGSIDVDASILQEGEFVSKGFFGIKGGTTNVLRSIANEINELHDFMIDTHRLDYHIRTRKPILIGTKKIDNVNEIADKHYSQDAWVLANKITEQLKDREIEKQSLNEVNLIGGGPEFYEAGFKKHFETGYMKITVPKNARFKNVEGVLKGLMFGQAATTGVEEEIFEAKES